jgi:hypothetical protein
MIVMVRNEGGHLNAYFRTFQAPMGRGADGELWLGGIAAFTALGVRALRRWIVENRTPLTL